MLSQRPSTPSRSSLRALGEGNVATPVRRSLMCVCPDELECACLVVLRYILVSFFCCCLLICYLTVHTLDVAGKASPPMEEPFEDCRAFLVTMSIDPRVLRPHLQRAKTCFPVSPRCKKRVPTVGISEKVAPGVNSASLPYQRFWGEWNAFFWGSAFAARGKQV